MSEDSTVVKYEAYKLRKRQCIAELGRGDAVLHASLGIDASKRRNISLIENDRIVYASANAVVFQNIWNKQIEYLLPIDETGWGCVGVHPSRYFLVFVFILKY